MLSYGVSRKLHKLLPKTRTFRSYKYVNILSECLLFLDILNKG